MRTQWFNLLMLVALLLGLVPMTASAAPAANPPVIVEVEPALRNQIQTDGSTGYLIYFREKADLSPAYTMDWQARGQFVMKALQETAERTQRRVRAYLDFQGAEYQAFWVDNIIVVERSNINTFNALTAAFPEIEALRERRHPVLYNQEEPVPTAEMLAIEPNLTHVNADDVWNMGYTGQGMVVANIDSGVRYTHEALVNHYRGNLGSSVFDHNYNWYDPYDFSGAPNDSDSASPAHGSHTMGTMIGDDGGANQIGMAPGAQWIACQGFNPSSTDVGLLACGQFMVAPTDTAGNNPNADLRPNVVNNSWGDCSQTYDNWYEDTVNAWLAAGIYPVFSNGNSSNCGYSSPPGLNTVGNPARGGNVTGVGATGTSNGTYATYSNWGPTDNADTINPRGYPYLKPQVVAPGTNRSALGTGDTGYQNMSGTSMAGPHVAGLIALIWSAAPCLVGDYATTETIIEETATPIYYDDLGTGARWPNNATGWGEINALAAVEEAMTRCGDSVLAGTVTDAGTAAPIPGAQVEASASPTETRSTLTDLSGLYAMNLFSGTYTVTVSAFGYQTTEIADVAVATGVTTTLDVALNSAAWYTVTGTVTDGATGWPLYAEIAIDGYPGAAIWTNPETGAYSISLPEGVAYTFNVTAWVAGYLPEAVTVGPLTGDAVVDIELDANPVACNAPGYELSTTPLFANSFEGATGGTFPADGWDQVDVIDTAGTWTAPTNGANPTAAPHTGTRLASFNSYNTSGGERTLLYRTAGIDLSAVTTPLASFWFFHGSCGWNNNDSVQLQASTDGGSTWMTVGTVTQETSGGWQQYIFNVSDYAGAGMTNVQFGLLGVSEYGCNVHVDDIQVVEASCAAPADGGLVVGNVYDYETNAPLAGALVENEAGEAMTTQATPDDPAVDDSFYTLFAPSGSQAFTVTLALYGPDYETVAVVDSDAVRQDFYLPVGHLIANPASLHATVDLGSTDVLTLALENIGSGAASWELAEKDDGWNPTLLSIPAFTGQLPESNVPTSFAHAPQTRSTHANDMAETIALLAGAPAYAVNLGTKDFVRIPDVDAPGTWTVVKAAFGTGDYYAGDFADADFSQLYMIDDLTKQLVSVNTATGAVTVIGACNPVSGQTWTGMSWDPETDTMYASATDGTAATLFTINLATGAATQVGTVTGASLLIDIAVNGAGEMYGVDIGADALVHINKTTGAATTVGALGANANYAQGLDFEEESGVLYWAAYTTTGELRVIDTTTGASALVGAFSGGAEVDSFAFATGGASDVLWLSEDPITGTVAAGNDQIVDVTFDASIPEITQPGDYYARLRVKNDTPYGAFVVPVTMTVMAPSTYGLLEGTVMSLGHCDADPALLEGAEVYVEDSLGSNWMVETDAAGYYQLWLDEAGSPVTVTVAYPVHEGGMATGIAITGGMTTTLDFNLRWLQPCVTADPTALNVTMELGEQLTTTLDLANTGAVGTDFSLHEKNQGFTPTAIGGPDTFGYQFADSNEADGPAYQWIDISATGTLIPGLGDDTAAGPFNIGFDFPFYGATQTQFYVGSNGLLSFDAGATSLSNQCPLPNASTPNNLIALLWDDLDFRTSGTARYQTFTACPYGAGACTIIQINNAMHYAGAAGSAGTWQAILFNTGNILIQFQDSGVETGSSSTTGIENADGTSGLTYPSSATCNVAGSIQDEVAVCFAYPGQESDCRPADVPWFSEDPITGTLAADIGTTQIEVTFDSAQVDTPGQYHADLKVLSDDPTSPLIVPVTMTITAPGDWGKLEGTVMGLGHCDADPAPLEGAVVYIESGTGMTWTLPTDVNGYYQLWLDAVYNPLTVTVSNEAGYEAQQFTNVPVTSGVTTTLDVGLRWLQPCGVATPPGLAVTLTSGEQDTLQLTLSNLGAAAMAFEVQERPQVQILSREPVPQLTGESPLRLNNPSITPYRLPAPNLADLIQDGGFEAGTPNPSWDEYSLNYGSPICDATGCGTGGGTAGAHSGTYWVWIGGHTAYEDASVAQDVTIPFGTASLSFWFWIGAAGDPADYMEVTLDGNQVFLATGADAATYPSYTLVEVDVSAYADGGTHELMFYGEQTTGNASNFNVDDVVLDSTQMSQDIPWLSEDPITGTVPADGARVVDVTFTAIPTMTAGSYYGTLVVQTNDPLAGPGGKINVPVTMTIAGAGPELVITKTVEPEVGLNLGGTVTYTLMLANNGNADAEGVLLTDTLPAGVTFGAFVSADGATHDAGVIRWSGALSATDTVEIVFTAIVSHDPMYSEQAITNRVDYTSTNAGNGFDEATFQIKRHYFLYLPLVTLNYTGAAR